MLFDVVTKVIGYADPAAYILNGNVLVFRLLNVDGVTYDYRFFQLRFSSYPSPNPGFGSGTLNNRMNLGFISPYSGSTSNLEYISAWGYGGENPPAGVDAISPTPVPFSKNDVDVMADCYGFNERPLVSEDITVDFPVTFRVNVSTYPAGYQRVIYVTANQKNPVAGTQVQTGQSLVQVGKGNVVVGLVEQCILYGKRGTGGQTNGKYLYREFIPGVTPISLSGYDYSVVQTLKKTTYDRPVTGYSNSHQNYPYSGIYDVGESKMLFSSSSTSPYPSALQTDPVYDPSFSLWGGSVTLSPGVNRGDRGNGPEAIRASAAGNGQNMLDAGREPTQNEITNSQKLFTAG